MPVQIEDDPQQEDVWRALGNQGPDPTSANGIISHTGTRPDPTQLTLQGSTGLTPVPGGSLVTDPGARYTAGQAQFYYGMPQLQLGGGQTLTSTTGQMIDLGRGELNRAGPINQSTVDQGLAGEAAARQAQQSLLGQAQLDPTRGAQQALAAQAMQPGQAGTQQGTVNSALVDAALGRGPSAAQAQYQQNQQAANQAAFSMAAGAGPRDAAAARRAAINAVAAGGQQAALSAAQLRAQEQQGAQGLATQALAGTRQANLAGLQAASGINQGITSAYQTGQNMALQNANGMRSQDQALAQLGTQAIQAQHQNNVNNYGQLTTQAINAAAGQQATQANYQLQRESLSNQRMGIANNVAVQAGAQNLQAQQQAWNQEKDTIGMFAGTAEGIAKVASDARLKRGITPASGATTDAMLALRPVAYEYRPEVGDRGGRHVGILAQDLERTPAGRALVVDTPQGKMVDMRRAVGLVLAHSAELTRRVAQLEKGGR